MRTHRVAAIGGDGIGPEVIAAGLTVIDQVAALDGAFRVDVTEFDWGSARYRKTGAMMPADGVDQLRPFDAIYFGAVGAPDIPDHITLWDLRLAICQGLDQYANVRPTRLLGGRQGPLRPELGRQIDWVIVRENSEGEYAGVGGRAHSGLPLEVAMDLSVFTRGGIERIARFAAELAMSRPRKRLTVVTKSNAQRHGMVLWDEVCQRVLAEFPELEVDWKLVDAMAALMVTKPGAFDTILATNLHADILSDLASALTGSLGNGATANVNPVGETPSMFEPICTRVTGIVRSSAKNVSISLRNATTGSSVCSSVRLIWLIIFPESASKMFTEVRKVWPSLLTDPKISTRASTCSAARRRQLRVCASQPTRSSTSLKLRAYLFTTSYFSTCCASLRTILVRVSSSSASTLSPSRFRTAADIRLSCACATGAHIPWKATMKKVATRKIALFGGHRVMAPQHIS